MNAGDACSHAPAWLPDALSKEARAALSLVSDASIDSARFFASK
jgi:hypothetical protein